MDKDRDEAEVAACAKADGTLYSLQWFLRWHPGEEHATLDGEFSSHHLRAIADHMEKHRAENK